MNNLFRILTNPENIFSQIQSVPKWKGSFLVVVVGNSFLTWIKSCLRGSSIRVDAEVLIGSFIISGIVIAILWFAVALFLHSIASMFNSTKEIKFIAMLSLVSSCGIICLIGELLNFVLIRLDIIRNSMYLLPGRFPIGLDLFLIGKHPELPLIIILYSINPITIWYLATLSSGLCSIAGIGKPKARLTSLLLWAFGIGFLAILSQILGGTSMGFKLS
jgi:Yip1 domain